MLIPFSLDAIVNAVNNFSKRIKWRINVKFNDNSIKLTSIHSIFEQSIIRTNDCKIDDNFTIIYLICFNNYQNQYLYLINSLILEFLTETNFILNIFLFHVKFKFIEIYNNSYMINAILCVCFLLLVCFSVLLSISPFPCHDDNILYVYF